MTLIPRLETERLVLRAPCEADLDAEAAFFASDASRFVGGPMRRDETWRTIAMMLGHWMIRGYGLWGVEEKATGAYVGHVGLWCPEAWPEPEIGWTLITGFTGKGYATEAALAARAHAYDVLGWDTAVSLIAPENTGSRKVAERLGATHETGYEHPAYGTLQVWRHLGPSDIENGGMEAYA